MAVPAGVGTGSAHPSCCLKASPRGSLGQGLHLGPSSLGVTLLQILAPGASTGMCCKAEPVKPGHPCHQRSLLARLLRARLAQHWECDLGWINPDVWWLLGPQPSHDVPQVQHHLKEKHKQASCCCLVRCGLVWFGLHILYSF